MQGRRYRAGKFAWRGPGVQRIASWASVERLLDDNPFFEVLTSFLQVASNYVRHPASLWDGHLTSAGYRDLERSLLAMLSITGERCLLAYLPAVRTTQRQMY